MRKFRAKHEIKGLMDEVLAEKDEILTLTESVSDFFGFQYKLTGKLGSFWCSLGDSFEEVLDE